MRHDLRGDHAPVLIEAARRLLYAGHFLQAATAFRGTLRSGADCRACRDARRPVPGRRARFARNAAVAARKSGPTAGSRPSARGSRSARRLTRKPPARARLDSRAVRARPPVLRPPAPRFRASRAAITAFGPAPSSRKPAIPAAAASRYIPPRRQSGTSGSRRISPREPAARQGLRSAQARQGGRGTRPAEGEAASAQPAALPTPAGPAAPGRGPPCARGYGRRTPFCASALIRFSMLASSSSWNSFGSHSRGMDSAPFHGIALPVDSSLRSSMENRSM